MSESADGDNKDRESKEEDVVSVQVQGGKSLALERILNLKILMTE